MNPSKIIQSITSLINELKSSDLKMEAMSNPQLAAEMDAMFEVVEGMRGTWVEIQKFIECNRWNIVMVGGSLKNVHYIFLKDGVLQSVGPIKKINVKSHTILLEGQDPYTLENLCPKACDGLEVGKNQVAEHFKVRTSDLTFVAEKLMLSADKKD